MVPVNMQATLMKRKILAWFTGVEEYEKNGIPMTSLPADGRDHHLARIIVRRLEDDRFVVEIQTDGGVVAHMVGPTRILPGGSLRLEMPP